jgi:hypothetical protein
LYNLGHGQDAKRPVPQALRQAGRPRGRDGPWACHRAMGPISPRLRSRGTACGAAAAALTCGGRRGLGRLRVLPARPQVGTAVGSASADASRSSPERGSAHGIERRPGGCYAARPLMRWVRRVSRGYFVLLGLWVVLFVVIGLWAPPGAITQGVLFCVGGFVLTAVMAFAASTASNSS